MSHKEDTKPQDFEVSKNKRIRNLKVENARLKHKLMIQQAIAAIECSKKPNWGIKNDH